MLRFSPARKNFVAIKMLKHSTDDIQISLNEDGMLKYDALYTELMQWQNMIYAKKYNGDVIIPFLILPCINHMSSKSATLFFEGDKAKIKLFTGSVKNENS